MIDKIKNDKLGLGGIFSASFKIFINHAGMIALLVILLTVPYALFIQSTAFNLIYEPANLNAVVWILVQLAVVSLLFVLLYTILVMMVTIVTEKVADGDTFELWHVFRQALKRFLPMFVTFLIMFLLAVIVVGLLMLITFYVPEPVAIFLRSLVVLGWFYLGIKIFFFVVAVTIRERMGFKALSYSNSLVKGNWWRVFFYLVCLFLSFGVFQAVPQLLLGEEAYIGALAFLYPLSNFLAIYSQVFITVLFLNLEYRKNPFQSADPEQEIPVVVDVPEAGVDMPV